MAAAGHTGLQRGIGVVSGRMNRNLRLHVGMVRTIVKMEIDDKGDMFPGKVGLKHEEPLATNVLAFWDKMCRTSTRNLNRKWYKHLLPYLIVMSGEDFVNELGPDGHLTSVGWGAVSGMLVYKDGGMYGDWEIRWRHLFDLRFVVRLYLHFLKHGAACI
ncbi:uncharacterized protein LOC119368200 [Triticum dicoccoides]|nr:uncharacterized protein LOC119368200 [Triticum dicoccoides]